MTLLLYPLQQNSPGGRSKSNKLGSQTQALSQASVQGMAKGPRERGGYAIQAKRKVQRRGYAREEEEKGEHYTQVAERLKDQGLQLQLAMHRMQQTGIFIYDPMQVSEFKICLIYISFKVVG